MSRALIASVLLLFVVSTTRGAEELLPPFGFRWNDPMSRVEAVLKGAKATIISRGKKENRELWTVEGLVHPGLKRTLFTFPRNPTRSSSALSQSITKRSDAVTDAADIGRGYNVIASSQRPLFVDVWRRSGFLSADA